MGNTARNDEHPDFYDSGEYEELLERLGESTAFIREAIGNVNQGNADALIADAYAEGKDIREVITGLIVKAYADDYLSGPSGCAREWVTPADLLARFNA